jgi:YVTN family beta-propeller protein
VATTGEKKHGQHYPAGIAFSRDGRWLYAAENLSDTVAVIDVTKGRVVQRIRTDRYPYAVAVSAAGDVYVSSWGDDTVVRFRPRNGVLKRVSRVAVARHPSAMLIDDDTQRLYVVSASTDSISVVDLLHAAVVATLHDSAPANLREGTTPNALVVRGNRLFVAEADANAVAVFDLKSQQLLGRVPTAWYPSALVVHENELTVVAAKGKGSAPNPQLTQPGYKRPPRSREYTLGQLNGSVMTVRSDWSAAQLASLTRRVNDANGWSAQRTAAKYPPLRHVIYIIKENRTYDQLFGDLAQGDGDPSLVYFGRDVTPNHHALAERFGLFDRFLTNAEVSAQGHNWSTAAYCTDYVEKTTPSNYSDRGRTYDYEGTNRDQVVDDDDDVASPAAGYLWDLAIRKGVTLRNYGEFLAEDDKGRVIPTRRALIDSTHPTYPGFDLNIPDQRRADMWIGELGEFAARGEMPALQIVRLGNDHTSGGAAGKPTPRAYLADNDLALGRMIEALTKTPFWKDTVVFVVEDDAQNGPDHVDSHRAPFLAISPYSRGGVIHRFANTTDVLATIEEILGLDSLSTFDHFGRPLRDIFGTEPDLRPYSVLTPAVDLNDRNPPATDAAKRSAALDFTHADAIDDEELNRILWMMAKGNAPYPGATRAPIAGAIR